jgi:FkbH-like protein
MSDVFATLSWLPCVGPDFADQCRHVLDIPANLGRRLQRLASFALTETQLAQLGKQVERARSAGYRLEPLIPFRLGLVSNATTDFIRPALVATALRHGIALECVAAPFGQVAQEALSSDSTIQRAEPDAVLVAVDGHGLPLRPVPGDAAAAEVVVAEALDYLESVWNAFNRNLKASCIVQTIARPVDPSFGSLDLSLPGTLRNIVDTLNRAIAVHAAKTDDVLLDVAGLAETVGLDQWHSPIEWHMAKLPFANKFVPIYAEHVCRLLAAMKGKSRRCLVLDLDNTLWSGVIGDDGLEGIIIGQGDPTGEAYLNVQQVALGLRERGIVLAVSSKNEDATARLPFQQHPEMLLREEHIAVFQANWRDKAENIRAIALELSLGLDALVFLDDNPAERDLVRRLVPEVAVLELPTDPSLYTRTLMASGHFEAVTFSAEDRARADFYRDNARRVALQKQSTDLEGFLRSLEMIISFRPFDEIGRSRVAQLINKSNQFNLTTRRYSEAEVKDVAADADCFTLQVGLSDIYGDNGMISVIICRRNNSAWHIDTWLMSCRVLGRGVERAVLQEIVHHAELNGIDTLVGTYHPTARNGMVQDHYAGLGFDPLEQQQDGTTLWRLNVADRPSEAFPMEIRRSGFAIARAA